MTESGYEMIFSILSFKLYIYKFDFTFINRVTKV